MSHFLNVRVSGIASLLLTVMVLVGCGNSQPSNTIVSGRLEVAGGIPLGEGKLILVPEDPLPGQNPAGATINSDGTFTCYSSSGGSGIPPGAYKIMVSFPSAMTGPHPLHETFKRYTKLDTTPLRIEVPPGGLRDLVLELQDEQS